MGFQAFSSEIRIVYGWQSVHTVCFSAQIDVSYCKLSWRLKYRSIKIVRLNVNLVGKKRRIKSDVCGNVEYTCLQNNNNNNNRKKCYEHIHKNLWWVLFVCAWRREKSRNEAIENFVNDCFSFLISSGEITCNARLNVEPHIVFQHV